MLWKTNQSNLQGKRGEHKREGSAPMAHNQEVNAPLQQRVNDYLRSKNPTKNIFSAAARDTDAADADLQEYLLKRAEEELRQAQARVEAIKQKIAKSQEPRI